MNLAKPNWRQALGALIAVYSQAEIADRLLVRERTVHRWKSGRATPTKSHARRIVALATRGRP